MENKELYESSWWLNEQMVNDYWWHADRIFTDEELDKIIQLGENGPPTATALQPAKVAQGKIDIDTRACSVAFLNSYAEDTQWIYQRLTRTVVDMNNKFFHYDLNRIESLQFTKYESGHKEFYEKHVDAMYKSFAPRKLSFSMMLSDPDNYEGGDLLLHYGKEPAIAGRERGKLIFFPSYMLHEVTPVTSGLRYSLVGWVSGPPFR